MAEQTRSHAVSWIESLLQRINTREAHVAVIGLGYVGLPLAVEFARAGLRVTGIDVSVEKVESLNASRSYITDITDAELIPLVAAGLLCATDDYSVSDKYGRCYHLCAHPTQQEPRSGHLLHHSVGGPDCAFCPTLVWWWCWKARRIPAQLRNCFSLALRPLATLWVRISSWLSHRNVSIPPTRYFGVRNTPKVNWRYGLPTATQVSYCPV